jgi:hypothetical protein
MILQMNIIFYRKHVDPRFEIVIFMAITYKVTLTLSYKFRSSHTKTDVGILQKKKRWQVYTLKLNKAISWFFVGAILTNQ